MLWNVALLAKLVLLWTLKRPLHAFAIQEAALDQPLQLSQKPCGSLIGPWIAGFVADMCLHGPLLREPVHDELRCLAMLSCASSCEVLRPTAPKSCQYWSVMSVVQHEWARMCYPKRADVLRDTLLDQCWTKCRV